MLQAQIRNTTKGEYLKRTESARIVYVRGEYIRQRDAFACHAFDDFCKVVYIKADKTVFVDFEF